MALQAAQRSSRSPGILALDKGKKTVYQNRSWVRGRDPEPLEDLPDGAEAGRPSLLSRLGTSSLLTRIAPSAGAAPTPSLADRLTDPIPLTETTPGEDYDEDVDMRDEAPPAATNGPQVKTEEETIGISSSPTRARYGWRTRGSRPTIDVFGEPTEHATSHEPQDLHEDPIEEDEDLTPESPVSDAAVEAILADILHITGTPSASPSKDRTVLKAKEEPSPHPSHVNAIHQDPVPAGALTNSSSSSSSSLPNAVLEKCRELLMPTIVQFAKQRNPSLKEDVAEKRALERLSNERCAEFWKLAQQMQAELQAQGTGGQSQGVSMPRTSSVLKRPHDGEDHSDEQPVLKIPRTDSPGEMMSEGEGVLQATQAAARVRSSTPARGQDSALVSLGSSSTANLAVGVPLPVSETPRADSPRRSDTPMSVTPIPSTSALPARHSSIQPLGVSSSEEQLSGSTDSRLLITQSPVTAEYALSAQPSLLPTPISVAHSATPPTPPRYSRSPPPAEILPTFPRLSLDSSHHGPESVTQPSRATTKDPPVAQETNQDATHDAMQEKQDMQVHNLEPEAATLPPALWAAVQGKPSAGVENVEFIVDDATAKATRCWAKRKETFSFDDRHVQVYLLCLPAASVSAIHQNLPAEATREDVVAAIWNIPTEWPDAGTLLIQADSDCAGSPWVPNPQSGPLDLTAAIKRGTNTFKLIQLAGMSNKLFVFHATEPREEERKTVGLQTQAWLHSLSRLAPRSPTTPPGRR